MKPSTGYYSIIQYCPDPSRQEAANVGLVLLCPEHHYIGVRTAKGNHRIRRFFKIKDIDRDQLNIIKMSIERRIEIDRDEFVELEDLKKFAATRANAMRLTAPMMVPVEEGMLPETLLQKLFNRLVGDRIKNPSPQIRDTLDAAFHAAGVSAILRRNVVVTLPVFNRQITFPYGFQNGRFNLIQPVRFRGLSPVAIMERVGKWALEGNLLHSAPDQDLGELRVIVVGQFAASQAEVARTVGELLEKNNTTLYRLDKIDKLVEEISMTGQVT